MSEGAKVDAHHCLEGERENDEEVQLVGEEWKLGVERMCCYISRLAGEHSMSETYIQALIASHHDINNR